MEIARFVSSSLVARQLTLKRQLTEFIGIDNGNAERKVQERIGTQA
jgi:hypothetical protein